jgi:hypothetical protein
LLLWSIASSCLADTWSLPVRETFYAKNRRFAVAIEPKKVASPGEYFKDKAEGRPNPGAVEGAPDDGPRAFVYSVGPEDKLDLVTSFKLVNEVAPLTALVSGDGRYLVTFDNWHSAGYGNDVVVIYRTDGSLVRSLSLQEIVTAKDLAALPRTTSSIVWGSGHSLDEDRELLVLRLEQWTRPAADSENQAQIAIRLADGMPLQPARDLLP